MNMTKMINKIKIFFIISLFLLSSLFTATSLGENKLDLSFETNMIYSNNQNEIISIKINAESYEINSNDLEDYVAIEDFGRLLVPGKPDMPSKIFSIAIPPKAEIVEIKYDLGNEIILSGEYKISPSSLPRVLGIENPDIYEQEKQKYNENYLSTYFSNDPYPHSNVEFIRNAGFRKYNLVDVRVTPFSYKPLSEKLIYYPEIKIDIEYEISDSSDNMIIDYIPQFEKNAEQFIYNYQQAQNWYPPGTSTVQLDSYNYVIITTDSLMNSVQPLKDWETLKGNSVNVVTSSWIETNYDGYDLAEQIRNFLRDKYPSGKWGIENVLLVGHYNDIPMRRTDQDVGYGKPETDFYYAELSESDANSWDSNGDHQYGGSGDQIDFYNEVIVGRIPWSSPTVVSDICNKSVFYEQNNDTSYKKNILLLGAYFWDDTDNAVLMEKKVNQPWMTDWTMTRMYEQGHSNYQMDYDLKNSNVVSIWSSNKFGFVNYAGHGSTTASFILYTTGEAFIRSSDTSIIGNDYPSIVFADACSNSDTDSLSIGQMMINKGAVGFVGATKVAFGDHAWFNPMSGSSQSLDYYFTTYVTSGDYTQGEAHQQALRNMYQNGLWYYTRYETFEWAALFGNPNLGMSEPTIYYQPEILNILTDPVIQDQNYNVNISCEIIAPQGLNNYNVIITQPDLTILNNTMINIPGIDTYYYNDTYTQTGNYEYYIYAKDINNMDTTSDVYTFQIGIPPEISQEIATPLVQQNGNNVNITCNVIDNNYINSVIIYIINPLDIESSHSMNLGTTLGDTYYYNNTYTIDGIYKYKIIASDNSGNTDSTVINFFYIGENGISKKFNIETGWNLISSPIQNDLMASEIADGIEGCLTVNKWDNTNQTYKPYIVGGPPDFDFVINPGMGLFIEVENPAEIILCGSEAINRNINLNIPWNLIGWYKQSDTTASSLAENITGCLTINKWDSTNQTYKPYIVGGPPDFDFTINAGMGLFIEVSEISTWNGSG